VATAGYFSDVARRDGMPRRADVARPPTLLFPDGAAEIDLIGAGQTAGRSTAGAADESTSERIAGERAAHGALHSSFRHYPVEQGLQVIVPLPVLRAAAFDTDNARQIPDETRLPRCPHGLPLPLDLSRFSSGANP
jgi:hypothetical protein